MSYLSPEDKQGDLSSRSARDVCTVTPSKRASEAFLLSSQSSLKPCSEDTPIITVSSATPMEPLRINSRLIIPAKELHVSFARAGGPGGQKVNRTASQVQLRFSVTESASLGERRQSTLTRTLKSRLTSSGELLIRAKSHREQARNLEDARERLASLLREALQPQKARRATKPTKGSKQRRLESKRRQGRRKQERSGRFDT